ncbi:MAG: DUF1553 domain-containing protein [Pirellulales bacterium]|nr:DUF1553 domain-containing protein [Pirellulales bacterium]
MNELSFINRTAVALSCIASLAAWAHGAMADGGSAGSAPSYNRDVRPILAENCFRCHGPDANERQAELRLDTAEGALAETSSGAPAVVPGHPEESELVRRISSTDEREVMPPPDSGKRLVEQQRQLLRAWISEGAAYEKHWSFISPHQPATPSVASDVWCRNAIDRFILKRLADAGLSPSPEADRRTLIRRVSFDLAGLPPTIAEVDAFLADESPQAYERIVDRLLASPRYGERMAVDWLDLARYADTDGYEKDSHRQMWPYRDWVIAAFNSNMPFDQFTIEQLAGDLLPDATQSQRIASAFNRNGPTTSEAGSDPAEYAVKYAVDRLTTTSAVWLGLTMQCAECHDHKFDPLTVRDFYSFMAFFDQVPETPLYEGAESPPSIPAFAPEQQTKARQIEQRLARAQQTLSERERQLLSEQPGWEAAAARREPLKSLRQGIVAEFLFDGASDDAWRDSSCPTTIAHVECATPNDDHDPSLVAGIVGGACAFDGHAFLEAGPLNSVDVSRGFSYGAWVKPTAQGGVALSCTDPQSAGRGFDLYLQAGRAMVHITDAWPAAAVKLTTKTEYVPDEWLHLFVTCSGGEGPQAVNVYFDGIVQPTQVDVQGAMLKSVVSNAPLRIGSRAHGESAMHGAVDEVRVYDRVLSEAEIASLAGEAVNKALQLVEGRISQQQRRVIDRFYRSSVIALATASLQAEAASYQQQYDRLRAAAPMVRVMADVPQRHPTHIRLRGDYRNLGEEVQPAVPAILGTIDAERVDRLALAKWLVGDENPLTARVVANRLWAACFGIGLVKTVDDFGSQGQWPSHPELLDWLAIELRESGWDVKHLLRLIVTSSAYRQSSAWSKATSGLDPENRLVARGPRIRLPAEIIRDCTLAAGGLLEQRLGGPSVFPYHPPGLWEEMAWADAPHKTWIQDHGPNLYRRGLYTFWKRSLVHPVFSVFDAPTRNTCALARPITNSPLQSLVTLNETSFVEAARGLAGRASAECGGDVHEQIAHMYLVVLARPPQATEAAALESLYEKAAARFSAEPAAAERFLAVGDLPRPEGIDAVRLAAATIVAQAVLNLDEAITKE